MKIYCKNKCWKLNEDYNIDKILYLLIDKPDEIILDDFYWKNEKRQFHRNYDLPTFIDNNGYVAWYKNNIRHRDKNKPARIFYNGYYCYKEYFINGIFIKEEK